MVLDGVNRNDDNFTMMSNSVGHKWHVDEDLSAEKSAIR